MRDSVGAVCARLLIALILQVAAPAIGADDGVELRGEPVQGGLIIGHADPAAIVRLDGEALRRSDDGHFLIGFGRDDQQPRKLEVSFADGRMVERVLRPAEREFDIQHIDGLPSKMVTPDPEALKRIRDEAAMTSKARRRVDPRSDFGQGFAWPVTGPITGVYGSQRILNGQPRNPHWGIDIAASTGTLVRAPAPGIVTLAHPDMYFSGGTLLLDHGLGLSSAFLHLSEILVETGQRVELGDPIARVGATGRVTGPHLDWRMNLGATRVDPELLLGPMPERIDAP